MTGEIHKEVEQLKADNHKALEALKKMHLLVEKLREAIRHESNNIRNNAGEGLKIYEINEYAEELNSEIHAIYKDIMDEEKIDQIIESNLHKAEEFAKKFESMLW